MPLHPKQFAVNEAWLAFKATRSPVLVEDVPHHVYIVQDAASMYIFGNTFAPAAMKSPTAGQAGLLLTQAWQKKREWPRKVLIPGRRSQEDGFAAVAALNGITVEFVPARELSLYINDVQTSYAEFLSREPNNDA